MRIVSDNSFVENEKIAIACRGVPATIPDHKPKIIIFLSKPLHRAPMQNRPKRAKHVDFSISTRFLENFPLAS
jgi:hypothetical protein